MNGDTTPGGSAGSKRGGGSEKCSAPVICPSGAASAVPGATSAIARTASAIRVRELVATIASGIEDDLHRIAGAPLEHVDRLAHSGERELGGDERLGGEPAPPQQRQGAADTGAALAALGVDRDVPPHCLADVGGDRPVVE